MGSSAEPKTRNTEVLRQFAGLGIWRRGEERAPHKPLLALYALARCLRGDERLIPFANVDADLRKLLREFGPARKSYHPEYPFWRLQKDGIWEITPAVPLEVRKANSDPKRSEFLKHHISGGFHTELHSLLAADPALTQKIVTTLLESHFPESVHSDILDAIGIKRADRPAAASDGHAEFRAAVLRAYGQTCAVCGYVPDPAVSDRGLEAAHIKWPQAGGPDSVSNGLCLCVMHSKAFDRGVLGISELGTILVCDQARTSKGLDSWFVSYEDQPVGKPQRAEWQPNPTFLAWHREEVFRSLAGGARRTIRQESE